jgi:hypothetical protein
MNLYLVFSTFYIYTSFLTSALKVFVFSVIVMCTFTQNMNILNVNQKEKFPVQFQFS